MPMHQANIGRFLTSINVKRMDLKELESGVDPHVHWYYQIKKKPLFSYYRQLLKSYPIDTIVDVGSGSGFFSEILRAAFPDNIRKVWQVDIGYTEAEMASTRGAVIEKCHFVPEGISNSLIILMDVLEHLEDDAAMLRSIKEKAQGTNFFFITVPAFQSLWSSHDVYLGHFRRYKIPLLRETLTGSGWAPDNLYYMYGSIFPLVWSIRQIRKGKKAKSDMEPAQPLVNSTLKLVNSLELPFRKANKLAGVTCVAEGRIP